MRSIQTWRTLIEVVPPSILLLIEGELSLVLLLGELKMLSSHPPHQLHPTLPYHFPTSLKWGEVCIHEGYSQEEEAPLSCQA